MKLREYLGTLNRIAEDTPEALDYLIIWDKHTSDYYCEILDNSPCSCFFDFSNFTYDMRREGEKDNAILIN